MLRTVGAAVAIAYHLHKTPYVFPIIGVRSVEKLRKNIEALTITLSPEHMRILEDAVPLDPEFPNWLIVRAPFIHRALLLPFPLHFHLKSLHSTLSYHASPSSLWIMIERAADVHDFTG